MPTTPTQLHDPAMRAKLAAIVSQMDDDCEGVIVSAALAARRFLNAHGLRWRDVTPIMLAAPEPVTRAPPVSWQAKISECLARGDLLTERERNFLSSALGFPRLSPKQSAWLDGIVAKVRAA